MAQAYSLDFEQVNALAIEEKLCVFLNLSSSEGTKNLDARSNCVYNVRNSRIKDLTR